MNLSLNLLVTRSINWAFTPNIHLNLLVMTFTPNGYPRCKKDRAFFNHVPLPSQIPLNAWDEAIVSVMNKDAKTNI